MPYVGIFGALSLASFPRSRPIAVLSAGLAGFCLLFFRDPHRDTPDDNAAIYAAADGHVLRVDTPGEDAFLRGPCLRVVTFLSLFDVHVNRSPVAGEITLLERQRGGFAATFDVAASDRNAAELVGIEGERGRVLVRRTAGLIARRIVTWTRLGQHVQAGLKLGMLKFGSRTDVLFPLGVAQVLVKEGDYVRAGRTVIARYHETPS